jgi:hypothetical protein
MVRMTTPISIKAPPSSRLVVSGLADVSTLPVGSAMAKFAVPATVLKCHVPAPMHDTTTIGGFTIPSSDPLFLGIVAIHVLLGIAAAVAGLVAMLSVKAPGRHPRAGTWYFWLLASLFVTASALSAMRWAHAYHLLVIGAFAFAVAIVGREARRRRVRGWIRLHIAGMGSSYVLMLVASTTATNCRRSATCRHGPIGHCRSRLAHR